ncbi:uncharacterized protein AC631_00382 [Debaryomyces fabryi]|uniref:Uncharacterized protein n=1 Tax=Debaryomyces fabryi TaxID=58627 RepID=A0A0V1Q639_9ASCO|nr:uncharacterized protein AC631_00382 [Debaryomyces fabryi]KSA03927.1 hypothetical protein AC631_00382 [Debaryomyces fabryi]CUM48851.1 unnamed protein product [Debaryomyces fabryi]
MTKNTFKRQKLALQPANIPSVPATVYETPKESLINFPSSIMNGITKEGGLVSLTFKSITCANFVENLDWMRGALIRKDEEFEPTRINEDVFNGEKMITELKQDIQALKEKPQQVNTIDEIKVLQSKLTNSLKDEESFRNFGINLVKQYEIENPTKSINFNNESYSTITKAEIPGVKVSKFEDVENPDLSAYERKPVVEPPKELTPEPVAAPIQEQTPSTVPMVLNNSNNSTPEMTLQNFQNTAVQQLSNNQVSASPSVQDNNVNSTYPNQTFHNSPPQENYY